jgi:hypothetical protein
MNKRDGREVARHNEQRALKALHKYGWLRTRDLAALLWTKGGAKPHGFALEPIFVAPSAYRMAQRTLARLRRQRLVIWMQAPDGSTIYGLSEGGARHLCGLGISAHPGKNQVRRVSLSHYHHRRLSNELAILAQLQGYRVASETEIAAGTWLGGQQGVANKKPDVLVRDGKQVWWLEVERSRRNHRDYEKLLNWLRALWSAQSRADAPAQLPGGHYLEQVVFVCTGAFIDKVLTDLKAQGWNDTQISSRILPVRLLYVTEAKFLVRQADVADRRGYATPDKE